MYIEFFRGEFFRAQTSLDDVLTGGILVETHTHP